MKPDPTRLGDRLAEIRARIARAAERSGRSAAEITLVGVAKTIPAPVVREAVAAGLRDVGENRVQEAEEKVRVVGRQAARWHMVGHLQRNKAARAAVLFDRIHSLDGLELAQALSRHAVAENRRLAALVQVNVSGEASKHGIEPEGLAELIEGAAELPGLEIDGLMSIGPPVERPEQARRWFARTRELRDAAAARLGRELPELSMGMSADFEVAVEEGSTLVRVGTALFGPRVGKD